MFSADIFSTFALVIVTNLPTNGKVIKKIDMEEKKEKKIPLAARIKRLEIGEHTDAPIEKLTSVKSTASIYGKMLQRKFRCNIVNEERVLRVTRVF